MASEKELLDRLTIREIVDNFAAKTVLVIEDVMRDAESAGDLGSIANILPGAARPLAADRSTMIVKLQGDADDLEPALSEECRRHR